MSEPRPQRSDPARPERGAVRPVRFEATIHAGRKARRAGWMDELGIDRVPDPQGRVRALVTADECVRLLEQGFEIRLHHAHPIRPLDPHLIETDEAVRRQLEERLQGLDRAAGPEGA